MEKVLVSACLIGDPVRYDGGSCESPLIAELNKYYDLVPFCPEMEGGLPCPRDPAEIHGNIVHTEKAQDVTRNYVEGANKTLHLCQYLGIKLAILKEASPSCGVHKVHSGFFDGRMVPGEGVTTALLRQKGIEVLSEEELPQLLERLAHREEAHAAGVAKALAAMETKQEGASAEPQEEKKPYAAKRPYAKKGSFARRGKSYGHSSSKEGEEGHSYRPHKSFGKKPYGKGGKSFGGKKPYGAKSYREKKDQA